MKKIKKIAITGGKGGTGKSTFAILLAKEFLKQGAKVILCDCDVECPNDYLLLNRRLKSKEKFFNLNNVKQVFAEFPKLIKSKCKKCGLCIKACYNNAIFQIPQKYPVFINDLCSGCGACQYACPNNAIEFEKKEIGKIYLDKISDLWLITGVANPGLEESVPIVKEAKKFALNFVNKINHLNKDDIYVLFDTAAGTHCPVVNALLDVDFAYAVTEPTAVGAYDLDLILSLCEKIKIPVKVVLNKADLGSKSNIIKTLKTHSAKIEKEILYSEKLAKKYSEGRLFDINIHYQNE